MDFLRKTFFQFTYLGKPRWDTGITPPEVMAFLESHTPGRALDLGCGTGTNALTLARHGWQVTGVDFVASAIQQAKAKTRQAGLKVDLRQGDVTRLPGIQGPFDLVLDIGCFHCLSPQGRQIYVQNLEQLLSPGGTFLMYAFIKDGDNNRKVLGTRFLESSDLDLLAARLKLVARVDGNDHGIRPSAWFTYQKPQ